MLYILVIICLIIIILFILGSVYNDSSFLTQLHYNDYFENTYYPVDMVYTWVDSTDKDWIEKRKMFEESILNKIDNGSERFPNVVKPDAELELSLELSLQNVPWIRTIYIVTMRPQIPKCLTTNDELKRQYTYNRIQIVHHDELDIPITFNSIAIEGGLHRIPKLSNNFLYFNDDMYIVKKLKPTHFFNQNKVIARLHNYFYHPLFLSKHYANWNNMLKYFKKLMIVDHGCCWILSKEIMKDAEKLYPDEWNQAAHSAFRNEKDIQPLGLSLNLGIKNKKVCVYSNDPLRFYAIHNSRVPLTPYRIDKIKKHDIICLNSPSDNIVLKDVDMLRTLFLK